MISHLPLMPDMNPFLTPVQYALELIGQARQRDVHTPFLKTALSAGKDDAGQTLSDSQLAEECMGGM